MGAAKSRAYNAFVKPQTQPANMTILHFDRPVIAAVNGPAVGWGMDLACLCDIIIASTDAKFASLFVKRGLIPDLGGLHRLPRLIGPQRAAEVLFTGRMIDAHAAKDLGLVSRVVSPDQ